MRTHNTNFGDVQEFHHKFGLRTNKYDGTGPQTDDPDYHDIVKFRTEFMLEEIEEFAEAYVDGSVSGNQAKMFDALLDLVYVAMGTASMLGYPWQEGWDEVQRANMTKKRALKDGSDSKRGSKYDIVKPEGWKPPDIEGVLRVHGFRDLG